MFFKKKVVYSEKDAIISEAIEARNELSRVRKLFDFAEDFEIANMQLTIAEMKYNEVLKKAKKFGIRNYKTEIIF